MLPVLGEHLARAADEGAGRDSVFAVQIKAIMVNVHRAERSLGLAGLLALAALPVVGFWRSHRRVGTDGLDEKPADGHSPPR